MNNRVKPQLHSARKAGYSSVVGQPIMLLSESGACIGQLSVIGTDDPQGMADAVVEALNAPSRHAYKVGVAVGGAREPVSVAEAARVLLDDKDAIERLELAGASAGEYGVSAALRALATQEDGE